MGVRRFELLTSSVSGKRSKPTELNALVLLSISKILFSEFHHFYRFGTHSNSLVTCYSLLLVFCLSKIQKRIGDCNRIISFWQTLLDGFLHVLLLFYLKRVDYLARILAQPIFLDRYLCSPNRA